MQIAIKTVWGIKVTARKCYRLATKVTVDRKMCQMAQWLSRLAYYRCCNKQIRGSGSHFARKLSQHYHCTIYRNKMSVLRGSFTKTWAVSRRLKPGSAIIHWVTLSACPVANRRHVGHCIIKTIQIKNDCDWFQRNNKASPSGRGVKFVRIFERCDRLAFITAIWNFVTVRHIESRNSCQNVSAQ